jgi:hypothetical protein
LGVAAAFACGLLAAPAAAGDRVYASAQQVEPLAAGSSVPQARLTTVKGETVELAALLHECGALLVFYRGGW